MDIETLLNEEIQDEFANLKNMNLGTEEYKITVDGVTKLVDRAIELNKNQMEYEERVENRKNDYDLKQKQMKEERKNRFIDNGIAIAGIVVSAGLTIWGTVKSLKFEEEGTVTSIPFVLIPLYLPQQAYSFRYLRSSLLRSLD